MTFDHLIMFAFILMGAYGVFNSRKASDEAIEQRMGLLNKALGKNLKVGEKTRKFDRIGHFVFALIFLAIGMFMLINALLNN